MKRLRVNKVYTPDGEKHFILEEFQPSDHCELLNNSDLTEIKKISRREAAKPLVLFREE